MDDPLSDVHFYPRRTAPRRVFASRKPTRSPIASEQTHPPPPNPSSRTFSARKRRRTSASVARREGPRASRRRARAAEAARAPWSVVENSVGATRGWEGCRRRRRQRGTRARAGATDRDDATREPVRALYRKSREAWGFGREWRVEALALPSDALPIWGRDRRTWIPRRLAPRRTRRRCDTFSRTGRAVILWWCAACAEIRWVLGTRSITRAMCSTTRRRTTR